MPRRVALLQSDVEILNTPSTDLRDLLDDVSHWDVDLYTERTVAKLVAASATYDCIVVAEDATIHDPSVIEELLAVSSTNMVLLRQREHVAYTVIGFNDEQLEQVEILNPRLTTSSPPREEQLMSWPHRLGNVSDIRPPRARILIDPQKTPNFIPVIGPKGHERYCCIARTPRGSVPRRVVSSVALEPAAVVDRALILNMVAFAAEGSPEVVVLCRGDDDGDAVAIARALGLQSAQTVAVNNDDLPPDPLEAWPLAEASTVICDRSVVDQLNAGGDALKQWLHSGARLVLLEQDASLTFRFGLSDPQWLAMRWTSWFRSLDDSDWIGTETRGGSILRTRAVFRVIDHVTRNDTRPRPEQLHLEDIVQLKHRAVDLVARRVLNNGCIDNEVGITAAGLELLQLCGAADSPVADRLRSWLHEQVSRCGIGDLVAAASVLGDVDTTLAARDAVFNSRSPDPLRTAIVRGSLSRCGLPDSAADEALGDELRSSPLIAAEYLAAIGYPHLIGHAARVEDALYALRRFGQLDGGHASLWPEPAAANVVAVNSEVLGLLRMYELGAYPAHPIIQARGDVSLPALRPLIDMTSRLRAEVDASRMRVSDLDRNLTRTRRSLNIAQHVVGAMIVALAIAGGTLLALIAMDLQLKFAAAAALVFPLIALLILLRRLDLAPPWLIASGRLLTRGRNALGDVLEDPDGSTASSA